jgi:hypothetical protein
LESVCAGNRTVGSNPTLSASPFHLCQPSLASLIMLGDPDTTSGSELREDCRAGRA